MDEDVIYGNEPMQLNLDCWEEKLTPAQESFYKNIEKEYKTVTGELQKIIGNDACNKLFDGISFKIYEVVGPVGNLPSGRRERPKPPAITQTGKRDTRFKGSKRPIVIDDDDDDDDLPLSKRIAKEKEKDIKTPKGRAPPKSSAWQDTPTEKESRTLKTPKSEKEEPQLRPTEANALGGLTIGSAAKKSALTGPDSKELTFNKIQGKTFPSLVVVARASLRANIISTANRPQLDSKVKVVLILTPAKFTEWLIQQGLLKSEQKCLKHKKNDLKLGVYSDGSKFPYTGGYVWISDCKPARFISVFNGSIFEGAPHPPSCILKLIYHWSCQTSIQNVIQWVKVDSLYVKTVYTWLRAICTIATQQHVKKMGGVGKYIEVGVISLGTTTQDGQQRQVKVEVLGVFEPISKVIRLRAIDPVNEKDISYKKRFAKILEPLGDWVQKESTIVIDLTIDRGVLVAMGFKNILQVPASDKTAKHSNTHVMDYLRRIVPRMFQNTLSLLSREMIQQFLDELVWREQYGTSPLDTFNNITKHIAEQTRMDTPEGLIIRLNKIASNPFINWGKLLTALPKSEASTSASVIKNSTKIPIVKKEEDSNAGRRGGRKQNLTPIPQPKGSSRTPTSVKKYGRGVVAATPARKGQTTKEISTPKIKEEVGESVLFEDTFYAAMENLDVESQKFPITKAFFVQCPDCMETFDQNIKFQLDVLSHIVAGSSNETVQCKYCLEKFETDEKRQKHIEILHPLTTKNFLSSYNCLICENRFNSIQMLINHMVKLHGPNEMPYRCGVCNYCSSSRRNVIDHFYETHNNVDVVQCNFCLMIFQVNTDDNGTLKENIAMYMEHLQQHMNKSTAKKCTKCSLNFVNKGALKSHRQFDHYSHSGVSSVKPLIPNSIFMPLPKLKSMGPKESTVYKMEKDFSEVTQCLTPGKICIECDAGFEEENHLIGFLRCRKCRYKTCCVRAMFDHTATCQTGVNPESSVHINLDHEYHCVCGFSSSDGNAMARHLAVCDHKSAYPSVEVAQENIVKRNMLDMLGLVRRSGDEEGMAGEADGGDDQEATLEETPEANQYETVEQTEEAQTPAQEETAAEYQPIEYPPGVEGKSLPLIE